MTANAIEVVESAPIKATDIVIPAAKASGWMAWCSVNVNADGQHYWCQGTVPYDPGTVRDHWRCPYPLFETKQSAIDACAKMLPNGGTIKLVRIEL